MGDDDQNAAPAAQADGDDDAAVTIKMPAVAREDPTDRAPCLRTVPRVTRLRTAYVSPVQCVRAVHR